MIHGYSTKTKLVAEEEREQEIAAAIANNSASVSATVKVEKIEGAMEVEETGTGEGEGETKTATANTTAVVATGLDVSFLSAQAERVLDRIQLCLTKHTMGPLHHMLDLGASNVEQDDPVLTLPLNQLTWAEIARMGLMGHTMQTLDLQKDDVLGAIRGGRSLGAGQQAFRTNKNAIRNIRYNMAVRDEMTISTNSSKDQSQSAYAPCVEDRLLALRSADVLDSNTVVRADSVAVEQGQATSGSKSRSSRSSRSSEAAVVSANFSPEPPCDFEADDLQSMLRCLSGIVNAPTGTLPPSAADLADQPSHESQLLAAYPDEYKRCALVLAKIAPLSACKGLLWPDGQAGVYHRHYLQVIRRPMVLANVATSLVRGSYGNDVHHTASRFYQDMRLCCLNMMAYYMENMPPVASAQRALLAIHRHATSWLGHLLLDAAVPKEKSHNNEHSPLPEVSACADSYCLYSGKPIVHLTLMRCGKCSGSYSLEAVSTDGKKDSGSGISDNKYLLPPTQHLIDAKGGHEEWICPLCLQEDSVVLGMSEMSKGSKGSIEGVGSAFYVDEAGPSAAIPWYLNSRYSRALEQLGGQDPLEPSPASAIGTTSGVLGTECPRLGPVNMRALKVLGAPARSSVVNCSEGASGTSSAIKPWSGPERVSVLVALLDQLRDNGTNISSNIAYSRTGGSAFQAVMDPSIEACAKLMRLASAQSFKEAGTF